MGSTQLVIELSQKPLDSKLQASVEGNSQEHISVESVEPLLTQKSFGKVESINIFEKQEDQVSRKGRLELLESQLTQDLSSIMKEKSKNLESYRLQSTVQLEYNASNTSPLPILVEKLNSHLLKKQIKRNQVYHGISLATVETKHT